MFLINFSKLQNEVMIYSVKRILGLKSGPGSTPAQSNDVILLHTLAHRLIIIN